MHLSCAETNTISKRTEQASTWHTLPRSTIGCVQSDFHARRLFRHKPCTYLAPRLKLSPNGSKYASAWSTSPTSTVRCVQNDLWAYGTFAKTMYLSCVEINTISKWAETSFHLTHVTLEYHRLRPKWFSSNGMFGVNRAPILLETNTISKWRETSFHTTYIT
jgi:hypothetical protein